MTLQPFITTATSHAQREAAERVGLPCFAEAFDESVVGDCVGGHSSWLAACSTLLHGSHHPSSFAQLATSHISIDSRIESNDVRGCARTLHSVQNCIHLVGR